MLSVNIKKAQKAQFLGYLYTGRGTRTRTQIDGFGDRCLRNYCTHKNTHKCHDSASYARRIFIIRCSMGAMLVQCT